MRPLRPDQHFGSQIGNTPQFFQLSICHGNAAFRPIPGTGQKAGETVGLTVDEDVSAG